VVPTYLHPGVYVEELSGPVHPPIRRDGPEPSSTRVATRQFPLSAEQSVAAFLGFTEQGRVDEPVLVTSRQQFEQVFGGPLHDGHLAHAVAGFFGNGGRACQVLRLNSDNPDAELFIGGPHPTGLRAFELIEDIATVCLPDLVASRTRIGPEAFRAVQLAMIAHCELMGDRIAVLDPPPGLGPQQIRDWRVQAGYDSQFAALYYPSIVLPDRTGSLTPMPASGHLAGSYARNDALRGFHRAPANEPLDGVLDVDRYLTRGELDLLSPLGINALVPAPGRGVVGWGARTLSVDPARRQLGTRRLLNVLVRGIRAGLTWAVFESPTDRKVWARIEAELTELLYLFWRAGTLGGDSPGEAFFVKCDADTNPSESLDSGVVVADVQLALEGSAGLRVVCYCG
jgi:hypothetical protein